MLRLCGDGWKDVLRELFKEEIGRLNTPNTKNIQDLFLNLLQLDVSNILAPKSERLKNFISLRGEIAHKGVKAGHVSYQEVLAGYSLIQTIVDELDNSLAEILKERFGKIPWKRRAAL